MLLSFGCSTTSTANNESRSVENELSKESNIKDDSSTEEDSENQESNSDLIRKGVAVGVTEAAKWIDSFFADTDYPDEDVDVELDLRQSVTKSESRDTDFKTRVSGRVRLPNAERKISLTFDGNDDDDENGPGRSSLTDSIRDADDQPSLGLEYLKERSPGYFQRVKLGYRFGENSFYLGGRLRKSKTIGEQWFLRASQRVRWYHKFGWENRSILDIEKILPENRFFQQRVIVSWREDEKDTIGVNTNFASSFIYPLSDTSAWRLIWSSHYHSQPKSRWVSSQLAWGYRVRMPEDWIFFEIRPFILWEDVFDWKANLGVTLSFDFIIKK